MDGTDGAEAMIMTGGLIKPFISNSLYFQKITRFLDVSPSYNEIYKANQA